MELVKTDISKTNSTLRQAMAEHLDSVIVFGMKGDEYKLFSSEAENRLITMGVLVEMILHIYSTGSVENK